MNNEPMNVDVEVEVFTSFLFGEREVRLKMGGNFKIQYCNTSSYNRIRDICLH